MYFKNNTGDKNLDHWKIMIADLLIADLTQSKYIEVLSGEKLFKILGDLNQLEAKSYSSDILKQVAAQGRVNHILVGNYAKAGSTIRINVTLQDLGMGKILGSEGVEGKGEESIFSLVDELTRRVKSYFNLSSKYIADDIDKEVGEITTSSPEAYKYYIEGRKYHEKNEFRQSIALMEKAIAIDPEFAMAYRSMAVSYGNLGLAPQRKKYIQKALELGDRLSDREFYQIQGDFYSSTEKTYDKAIKAYTKLLELYPDDTKANNNLGSIYSDLENWDKAIELYEQAKKHRTTYIGTYTSLADAYRAKGLYKKARETLEYYLQNISDNAFIHYSIAHNYLCQGKYDRALVEMDKAFTLDPTNFLNFYLKGVSYYYAHDLVEAEKEYQRLLEEKELRAPYLGRHGLANLYLLEGKFEQAKDQFKKGIAELQALGLKWVESQWHSGLASLYLQSGAPEEALKECDQAWESATEADRLDLQRQALHFRELAELNLKSIAKAQKTADELKELVEKGLNQKEMRRYYHLMGMIELKKANFSKAADYFKEAISLLPSQSFLWAYWQLINMHAFFINPLAFAYYRSGDFEKAEEEYKRIISLISGRLFYGDIYARSFYMLGKIYQKKGMRKKALQHYQKFLDLWKDADPGIPEVADVKKRVAGLKNSN